MKCFGHPQADAVAVCCHCGKGLCSGCALVELDGVTCTDPACGEMTRLKALQAKMGIAAYATACNVYKSYAVASGIFGAMLLLLGFFFELVAENSNGRVFLIFSILALALGLFALPFFLAYRRMSKDYYYLELQKYRRKQALSHNDKR